MYILPSWKMLSHFLYKKFLVLFYFLEICKDSLAWVFGCCLHVGKGSHGQNMQLEK